MYVIDHLYRKCHVRFLAAEDLSLDLQTFSKQLQIPTTALEYVHLFDVHNLDYQQ